MHFGKVKKIVGMKPINAERTLVSTVQKFKSRGEKVRVYETTFQANRRRNRRFYVLYG